MSEASGEPTKRNWFSFGSLTGRQTLNAFNDNLAKFVLIPCGVALAGKGLAFNGIEHFLGLLLVLPFILLAPTAGWLGDRFAKNRVVLWSAWFQIFCLGLMVLGLWLGESGKTTLGLWVAIFAFFLLAVQSALLSPAKMGVVKELVGSKRLGFANGVMEGTVILAILGGQIVGGIWFDSWGLQAGKSEWSAALAPVFWIWLGGGLALLMAAMIETTEEKSAEKFSARVAWGHVRDLRELVADRPLRMAAFGIAFFWGFGGFLQFVVIQIATERFGTGVGMGSGSALLWAKAVMGIAGGSLLASWICRKSNELGLVVVGGVLLAVGNLAMAVTVESVVWFKVFLGITGMGGAFFFVPLNAFLQDRAPDGSRGKVISASNLLINLAGVLAVVLQFAMKMTGVPVWAQFVFLGVICALATWYVLKLLPRDFLRLVVLGIFRSLYRVRVSGEKNVPAEGGVLLLANHLTYVDALVLQVACPREIRFVLIDDCFERPWVGFGARLFQAIPISSERAKDGIKVTAEALKEGSVVCLFPEGQLSRTGAVSELKRGFEIIARKADCAVVPAYLDGLWGSMWSFVGNLFLKRRPRKVRYGITVAWGEARAAESISARSLRGIFGKLSASTLADRLSRLNQSVLPKILGEAPAGMKRAHAAAWRDDENGNQMRANALQLAQVNVACRENRLLVEWDAGNELSLLLGILWPRLIDAPVVLVPAGASCEEIQTMREQWKIDRVILLALDGRESLAEDFPDGTVHVFSEEKNSGREEIYGGLVRGGRVLSFSLPHPDYETTTMIFQPGWKEEACGRLLPGFACQSEENGLRLRGPSVDELFLDAFSLDKEGFLLSEDSGDVQ